MRDGAQLATSRMNPAATDGHAGDGVGSPAVRNGRLAQTLTDKEYSCDLCTVMRQGGGGRKNVRKKRISISDQHMVGGIKMDDKVTCMK